MVAHNCNPSTQETKAGDSQVDKRPAWATKQDHASGKKGRMLPSRQFFFKFKLFVKFK
jgi:hypothetical protein